MECSGPAASENTGANTVLQYVRIGSSFEANVKEVQEAGVKSCSAAAQEELPQCVSARALAWPLPPPRSSERAMMRVCWLVLQPGYIFCGG